MFLQKPFIKVHCQSSYSSSNSDNEDDPFSSSYSNALTRRQVDKLEGQGDEESKSSRRNKSGKNKKKKGRGKMRSNKNSKRRGKTARKKDYKNATAGCLDVCGEAAKRSGAMANMTLLQKIIRYVKLGYAKVN